MLWDSGQHQTNHFGIRCPQIPRTISITRVCASITKTLYHTTMRLSLFNNSNTMVSFPPTKGKQKVQLSLRGLHDSLLIIITCSVLERSRSCAYRSALHYDLLKIPITSAKRQRCQRYSSESHAYSPNLAPPLLRNLHQKRSRKPHQRFHHNLRRLLQTTAFTSSPPLILCS